MTTVLELPNQGRNNLNPLERQALRNAAALVASLDPGKTISREQLIEGLRRPVPPADECESDAAIRHAYRHLVINAGVENAERVVTYAEAGALTGKSVEAIRQAAYRGALVKLTEHRDGRERAGVTLRSLADWLRWTPAQFEEGALLARKLKNLSDNLSGTD